VRSLATHYDEGTEDLNGFTYSQRLAAKGIFRFVTPLLGRRWCVMLQQSIPCICQRKTIDRTVVSGEMGRRNEHVSTKGIFVSSFLFSSLLFFASLLFMCLHFLISATLSPLDFGDAFASKFRRHFCLLISATLLPLDFSDAFASWLQRRFRLLISVTLSPLDFDDAFAPWFRWSFRL
jgi:hypothetical protein